MGYYEKSAPKDLEIISKALAAKQAEYTKINNAKIIKEKGEKQTQELKEKNAAEIALSGSKEVANTAEKEAQATAKEANHKNRESKDAAKRADTKAEQEDAEIEAATLTMWKDKKAKAKKAYDKSSKNKEKGAALMQHLFPCSCSICRTLSLLLPFCPSTLSGSLPQFLRLPVQLSCLLFLLHLCFHDFCDSLLLLWLALLFRLYLQPLSNQTGQSQLHFSL